MWTVDPNGHWNAYAGRSPLPTTPSYRRRSTTNGARTSLPPGRVNVSRRGIDSHTEKRPTIRRLDGPLLGLKRGSRALVSRLGRCAPSRLNQLIDDVGEPRQAAGLRHARGNAESAGPVARLAEHFAHRGADRRG